MLPLLPMPKVSHVCDWHDCQSQYTLALRCSPFRNVRYLRHRHRGGRVRYRRLTPPGSFPTLGTNGGGNVAPDGRFRENSRPLGTAPFYQASGIKIVEVPEAAFHPFGRIKLKIFSHCRAAHVQETIKSFSTYSPTKRGCPVWSTPFLKNACVVRLPSQGRRIAIGQGEYGLHVADVFYGGRFVIGIACRCFVGIAH